MTRGTTPSATPAIVIVGAGHAGVQLCAALAASGLGPRIHLVGDEGLTPYQRPPLSKSFLKRPEEALQWHRSESWFGEQGIALHLDDSAHSLNRSARTLTLASGLVLEYEWLVLATGTRSRPVPGLPSGLSNVYQLRTAADAKRLRSVLPGLRSLTVLGGGFIGLEVAATARAIGLSVRVLESSHRLLARSASPEVSAHVLETHRAGGTEVSLNVGVGGFELRGDRLAALMAGGERLLVEALLAGIGAMPETMLASAAGLACNDGVLVDRCMRSSDPAVLAIGDCARFPDPTCGRPLRLESVQNANDQARTAAATILSEPHPHAALPWFWSDQGELKLQIAGLIPAQAERFRRPGPTPASFSILHYVSGRLVCVESINSPLDHMAARRLLDGGISPNQLAACDPSLPLRQWIDPCTSC